MTHPYKTTIFALNARKLDVLPDPKDRAHSIEVRRRGHLASLVRDPPPHAGPGLSRRPGAVPESVSFPNGHRDRHCRFRIGWWFLVAWKQLMRDRRIAWPTTRSGIRGTGLTRLRRGGRGLSRGLSAVRAALPRACFTGSAPDSSPGGAPAGEGRAHARRLPAGSLAASTRNLSR